MKVGLILGLALAVLLLLTACMSSDLDQKIEAIHNDPAMARSCAKLYDWVQTQRAVDLTVQQEQLIQGCKTAGLYHSER